MADRTNEYPTKMRMTQILAVSIMRQKYGKKLKIEISDNEIIFYYLNIGYAVGTFDYNTGILYYDMNADNYKEEKQNMIL